MEMKRKVDVGSDLLLRQPGLLYIVRLLVYIAPWPSLPLFRLTLTMGLLRGATYHHIFLNPLYLSLTSTLGDTAFIAASSIIQWLA